MNLGTIFKKESTIKNGYRKNRRIRQRNKRFRQQNKRFRR